MAISSKIEMYKLKDEFQACPVCGYEMGFQVSMLRRNQNSAHVILNCPQCGARYDIGWEIEIPEE